MPRILWLAALLISAVFAQAVHGQETRPVDALQSTARVETTGSAQAFLASIWKLDPKLQARLLRARLTNATLKFSVSTKLKSESSTDYTPETEIQTGKKSWTVSSAVFNCLEPIKHDGLPLRCRGNKVVKLRLDVEIIPTPEMLEWMKVRDEYAEYSKNPLPDGRIVVFDFSGKISSASLTKVPNDYWVGESLTYALRLEIASVSTGKMVIRTESGNQVGTIRRHINFLKEKTADWVKHYMGKGKKPQPIF